MSNSTIGIALLIVAYIPYSPYLPSLAIFVLYLVVFMGVFACLIEHMLCNRAFRVWLNRYF